MSNMKWEDYVEKGYNYEDYIQLSQWQRLRGVWIKSIREWHHYKVTKKVRWPLRLVIVFTLYPFEDWKRFGLDQSQEYEHFYLGPIAVVACL